MQQWVIQKSAPGREVDNNPHLLLKVTIVNQQGNWMEWVSVLTTTYFPTYNLK